MGLEKLIPFPTVSVTCWTQYNTYGLIDHSLDMQRVDPKLMGLGMTRLTIIK